MGTVFQVENKTMRQGMAWKSGKAHRTGGFTLVEIVAAMALTVILMLGVVQVFKMASDAAGEAEATSDAYQMGRGVMTMLEQDLKQFSPEGYLAVRPQTLMTTDPSTSSVQSSYRFDALMFTKVGRAVETGTGAANPAVSTGSEVLWTFGLRAEGVKKAFYQGTRGDADGRGTLLLRKEFLVSADPGSQLLYPSALVTDSKTSLGTAMWEPEYSATPRYRLVPPDVGTTSRLPVVKIDTMTGDVSYVVCERVSEFIIDVWNGKDWAPGDQRLLRQYVKYAYHTGTKWQSMNASITGEYGTNYANATGWASNGVLVAPTYKSAKTPVLYRDNMIWTGSAANPTMIPGKTGVTDLSAYPPTTMPSMIRVTLVLHPHNDKTPLADQTYAATKYPQYQGIVFREVFRISGAVHHLGNEGTTTVGSP